MDTCLWVVGCKKPNPRINSCMELYGTMNISMELYGIVWNLTLSMEILKFLYGN